MKKGMILYVTRGKNDLLKNEYSNLPEVRETLGVQSLSLSTSEDEVADACFRMLTRGMHQVSCMAAYYHPGDGRLEIRGEPMRLAG
jgi:hypothetical protein